MSKKTLKSTQVFTPSWATNQMMDLLRANGSGDERLADDETFFFEPSVGDGQMLIVILDRVHGALLKRYKGDKEKALADLCFKFYAIDLCAEMVVACRLRLFEYFKKNLNEVNKEVFSSYVLARILHEKIEHKDFFKFMKNGASLKIKHEGVGK